MKKISEHISYREGVNSNYAKQYNIDNKPKAEHIKNMEILAEKVFEPLREYVGKPIKVNSFFRSKELNTRIGGAMSSSHLDGQAIDITTLGGKTNLEMFLYIKDNLDYDQIISEFPNSEGVPKWIHVSYKSKKLNRKQALEIKRKGRYTTFVDCKSCK